MTPELLSGDPLTVALALVELGVPVLPVHTPTSGHTGKEPRLRNGVHGATTDPQLIRGWLEHWPTTNIGAACGERLAVIDVDGPGEVRAMCELCADRPPIGGLRALTGRPGGWHIWFDHPGGPLRTRIADSLVRSGPTYVVAPPSLHASGNRYAFVGGKLEPPPAWFVDELRRIDLPSASPVFAPVGHVPATPADRMRTLLEANDDDELETIAAAAPANHHLYGQRALATAVEKIREAESYRHSMVNKSAFILGGLIDACGLDRDTITVAMSAAAEEAGLVSDADRAQTVRTILRGLEAGESKPRPVPEMTR